MQSPEACSLHRSIKHHASVSTCHYSKMIIPHVLTVIATSLAWILIILCLAGKQNETNTNHRSHNASTNKNITSNALLLECGHTTQDAIAKGCEYDILSNNWIPGVCMDQAAIEEYQSDGSWFGYADENRTEILTIEAMSQRDFYYTSERDHIVHCAMLWRKQFNAFFEGRTQLDTLIASKAHTMHCAKFLTDMTERGPDYWNMPIKTYVGFSGCWLVN